jgi:serine/threonine-protein kinase
MELLAGNGLGQLIERGGLGVKRSASIALQIAEALGAAHQHGVVHRDLKPDNVFVGEHAGRADYVKVLDFGVSKLADPVSRSIRATNDGAMVGTPRYMAPEQAASLGVDWRADIYALGAVLYEMLTGRALFEGEAFGALMADIITRPPPDLPHSTPSGEPIPAELAILVRRCVEKDPERRPQSMADVAKVLEPLAQGTAPMGRTRRSVLASVLGVVTIVAVVGGAFGYRALSKPETVVQPVAVMVRPSPRPSAPARVRLEVRTDPAGAKVTRLDTNQALGDTPLDLQLDRAEGDVPLRIERDGFVALERTVRLERDNTLDVSLAAIPPPPPPAVPKTRPPTTRPTPKERVGDDVLDPFAQ